MENFQLYYNLMGPLSYMCSIFDQNIVIWYMAVTRFVDHLPTLPATLYLTQYYIAHILDS